MEGTPIGLYKRATQAANFFAVKEGRPISRLKAVKLIWAADRYHIRKYGRPVIGDQYRAMEHGPVGSNVLNVIKYENRGADFLPVQAVGYISQYIGDGQGYVYRSLQAPDLSVFSETDREALEFAYDTFGSLNPLAIRDVSHDYPEWNKFEAVFEQDVDPSSEPMDYLDFFTDPKELKGLQSDPFALDPEWLEASKQTYIDNSRELKQWGSNQEAV